MRAGPLHVVFLARKLDPGGAERQLIELAKGLSVVGFEVDIVLFYGGGLLEEALEGSRVRLHHLGKTGRYESLSFFRRLTAKLRSISPDFVYSFLDIPNIIAALVQPWIRSAKIVWSIRTAGVVFEHYGRVSACVGWLEARLSCRARLIIANSLAGSAWASSRGFPESRIRVVENGVDTDRFRPDANERAALRLEWGIGETEKLVGLVGRIDPMKDHATFLRACARVAQSEQAFRIVCVGSGRPERVGELQALAAELSISAKIIWAGIRTDMPAVYNSLDVLCLSSVCEGFPNVVAEAMACGVPCVVSDVGDAGRIVGSMGKIVAPGDALALAGAIIESFQDVADRAGRADRAAKLRSRIVNSFSLSAMIDKTAAELRAME